MSDELIFGMVVGVPVAVWVSIAIANAAGGGRHGVWGLLGPVGWMIAAIWGGADRIVIAQGRDSPPGE